MANLFTIAAAISAAGVTYAVYKRRKEQQQPYITPAIKPKEPEQPPVIEPKEPKQPVIISEPDEPVIIIPDKPSPPVIIVPDVPIQPVEYRAPITVDIVAVIDTALHHVVSAAKIREAVAGEISRVRKKVEQCPNAPRLPGVPTVNTRKTGGGIFASSATYYATIKWPAIWSSEFLFDNTKACIENTVLELFGEHRRFVRSVVVKRG